MKFEISSDRGVIGPLVWYNQKQIRYYVMDDATADYIPVMVKEGKGYCFLHFDDVDVILDPVEWWYDLVGFVKRLLGKGDD